MYYIVCICIIMIHYIIYNILYVLYILYILYVLYSVYMLYECMNIYYIGIQILVNLFFLIGYFFLLNIWIYEYILLEGLKGIERNKKGKISPLLFPRKYFLKNHQLENPIF